MIMSSAQVSSNTNFPRHYLNRFGGRCFPFQLKTTCRRMVNRKHQHSTGLFVLIRRARKAQNRNGVICDTSDGSVRRKHKGKNKKEDNCEAQQQLCTWCFPLVHPRLLPTTPLCSRTISIAYIRHWAVHKTRMNTVRLTLRPPDSSIYDTFGKTRKHFVKARESCSSMASCRGEYSE